MVDLQIIGRKNALYLAKRDALIAGFANTQRAKANSNTEFGGEQVMTTPAGPPAKPRSVF